MINLVLRRPITVLMLCLGLCLLGVLSWQRLAVQLLPQFVLPEVQVTTVIPGRSPEQLEWEGTIPVEAELATLEGVRTIESQVFADYATTRVFFEHGTDMKFALLKLQQKMNALQGKLPQGARIDVNRFDTADLAAFLMQLSVRGETNLDDLREIG